MQLPHLFIICFGCSITSLTFAENIFEGSNLDDPVGLDVSELNIFDNDEANPSFNLFSDATSDNLAWDPDSSLEGSLPVNFLADAYISDDSLAACLSPSTSSSRSFLATDELLQARSSAQCPNPLDDSLNSGSITTPSTPTTIRPKSGIRRLERKTPIDIGSDTSVCPFERYGLRPLPLCDSGFPSDVMQDDEFWIIDLREPRPCTSWFIVFLLVQLQNWVHFVFFTFETETLFRNERKENFSTSRKFRSFHRFYVIRVLLDENENKTVDISKGEMFPLTECVYRSSRMFRLNWSRLVLHLLLSRFSTNPYQQWICKGFWVFIPTFSPIICFE